ncbi:MAG: 4a-hydroxytetrahydrobiopterin dehydratase [Candidatus Dadabacteria bacterium]|nr:4a-hydroxytetrahydrobiopterin dehydratase [Candidatus Dadabacteria bacterium]NIQ15261.1 4a-hydroxytetrahydrobiopterin dehydratase [Candidatus Dadabacteria bacterium]
MQLLTDDQISKELTQLTGWERINNQIEKVFNTKNFIYTIGFVNQVALLAERADHHPDILVQYSKVTITLYTHSMGGITEKDINLAKEIEQL